MLAGWSVEDSMDGLMPVLRLSEAGNIDLARASDLVTDSMSAMGLEVNDLEGYLDIVAQTARSSNTDIDAMMEAYLNVGGVLRGLKVPTEDSALALGLLANAGKKGGEAGKSLSAILTNLTAPTGRAKKALDELGFSAFDNQGNFKGMEEVLFDLEDKMKDMTQEQKNSYISMIAGKEHIPTLNALLNGLGDGYVDLKKDISNSKGALEDVSSTMRDNLKGSLEELSSAIQELGLKIYDTLKPAIKVLTEFLMDLVEKLNNMSPAMQTTIVAIGGIAAVIGPLIGILGIFASAIGGILTLFGTISGAIAVLSTGAVAATPAIGGLATAFGILSGPVGIAIGVIGGLGAGFIALNNHMKKSSIETESWKDDVSDSTKKAAGSFLDMNEEVEKQLTTLSITQEELTTEMSENLKSKYKGMKDTVIESLEESRDEAITSMTEMLNSTKEISEEEKQEIIRNTREGYEGKAREVEESYERVSELLAIQAEGTRELREDELEELRLHNEKMAEVGVETLVESSRDQMVILENLRSESSKATAETSAEVVKNSVKQKEEVIKNANETRDETVASIIYQRDEIGSISDEQAKILIDNANEQRKEAVEQAEIMHEDIVEEAKKQAEEHVDEVDWETGEIKSKWKMIGPKLKTAWGNIKEDFKTEWNEMRKHNSEVWSNIKTGISETFTKIVTTVKTKAKEVVKSVSDKWEEAKTKTKTKWDEIRKTILESLKKVPGKMLKIGKDIIQGLINGIQNKFGALKRKVGEIASYIPDKVREALETRSPSRVMMSIGSDVVAGLSIGMTDNMGMLESATKLATDTIKEVEADLSIEPVINIADDILKRNTVKALKQGEKAHQDYAEFLEKLNADEVERSAKLLSDDFRATETNMKKKIDMLKGGSKEKARAELNSLRENNKAVLSLLNERSSQINEKAKEDTDAFNDKMNQYDEAIKRLSIGTNDLEKDLMNQNAITILQEKRVAELTIKYSELAKKFGATSEESLRVKDNLKQQTEELVKMGEAVEDTTEKIRQSEIDSINDLSSRLKTALKQRYDEELKAKQESVSAEIKELDIWQTESLARINNVYDKRLKRINEVTNAQTKALQAEIQAIDDAEKDKSRKENEESDLAKISRLEDALEFEHNEFNKAEIQKEINRVKAEREKRLHQESIVDKKENLNKQIKDIQENANKEREILEIRKQEELARVTDIYRHEKETLDETLQSYQEHYDRVTEKSAIRAEAEKMIIKNNQDEIIKLLHSYEDQYERAGNSLGERLVEGMQPAMDKIMKSISNINSSLKGSTRSNVSAGVGATISSGASIGLPIGQGIGSDAYRKANPDMPYWLGGGKKESTVNNNVTINSPKALSASDVRRQTESTLRKVSFSM